MTCMRSCTCSSEVVSITSSSGSRHALPSIYEIRGGKTGVLDNVERLVRASANTRVGFVLDADDSVENTWRAISHRLEMAGVVPPRAVPGRGLRGRIRRVQGESGRLVDAGQPAGGRAGRGDAGAFSRDSRPGSGSVASTRTRGYETSEDRARSELSRRRREEGGAACMARVAKGAGGCRTAPQSRARYFRHDSPVAESFVGWFRRVFEAD